MRLIRTLAIAIGAIAGAAGLSGCATAPPFTVEEGLWFDKATGTDITRVPPGLRMEPIGYLGPSPRDYLPPPSPYQP